MIDLTVPLAQAIILMDDIAFNECQSPATGPQTNAWEALLAEAETVAGREAKSKERTA